MTFNVSLLLAGDALITRPWSNVRDGNFLSLIDYIRGADVAIANLETVIHEFKGHAQADSGGVYMASPPEIARELKWAGFDMLAHANNHAFDYGVTGILETVEHIEQEGLIIAGSGKDLQSARAPRYVKCTACTVGLVAMASDFVSYGRASYKRADLHGRPGVNPLTVSSKREIAVRPLVAAFRSRTITRLLLRMPALIDLLNFQFSASWGRCASPRDSNANLESISEAASNADIVIASIHAHRQGQWLRTFSRQAIDHGAHIVFIHGPHQVRGIELYRGNPIFYSMGDFVFEPEHVTRVPAEAYDRLGLSANAEIDQLRRLDNEYTSGVSRNRSAFEAFVALILFSGEGVSGIRLFPIDLNFDSKDEKRGRPRLASPQLGRRIIETVAERSRNFGTRIHYDLGENSGEVVVG
jgi:hypothetical protein